eukprot:GHUV01037238.1.p1 GENE.GHUV01037238.1~~GHUV01037238.1.p1  ORF type:complete len:118 (+),score=29.87 GHUV01037238.1:143-496(+)
MFIVCISYLSMHSVPHVLPSHLLDQHSQQRFVVPAVSAPSIHTCSEPALMLVLRLTRYALPRERGIFRLLSSPSSVTTRSIIQRIVDNRAAFEARNKKKVASEQAYYSASKDYVQEL